MKIFNETFIKIHGYSIIWSVLCVYSVTLIIQIIFVRKPLEDFFSLNIISNIYLAFYFYNLLTTSKWNYRSKGKPIRANKDPINLYCQKGSTVIRHPFISMSGVLLNELRAVFRNCFLLNIKHFSQELTMQPVLLQGYVKSRQRILFFCNDYFDMNWNSWTN